jgi:hypothetical protein
MAFVDEHDVAVKPARPIDPSDAAIMRAQDITIVRLRTRRVSWRRIGRFFNMSHEGVRQRWRSIPPEAREHYRQLPAWES